MDLVSFVVQPTWKEFLIELVNSNQMNPWEIDLVEVADKYLQRVRALQAMDLRIPANVILASALLLRFKADALQLEEKEELREEVVEEPVYVEEEIPELVLRANQPRRRKLTLEELIKAVDEVMRDQAKPLLPTVTPKVLALELPKEDMNELMKKVYARALEIRDGENVLLFSDLIKPYYTGEPCPGPGNCHEHGFWCYGVDNVVRHLLPVLHLVQENKLLAWQDELFGEIFLRVMDEKALAELERRAREAAEKEEKEEEELQARLLARRQQRQAKKLE